MSQKYNIFIIFEIDIIYVTTMLITTKEEFYVRSFKSRIGRC